MESTEEQASVAVSNSAAPVDGGPASSVLVTQSLAQAADTPPESNCHTQSAEDAVGDDECTLRTDSPPATINLGDNNGPSNEVSSNLLEHAPHVKPPQLSPSSGSSSSSTPVSSPFKAHFTILSVKIASQKESLNPSPEFATYLIESKRNSNVNGTGSDYGTNGDASKVFLVKRQWEDIEFLDHCLAVSAFPSDGLIIPPLPPKLIPACGPEDAIDGSYEHLLKTVSTSYYANSVVTPRWVKDCDEIFEYLGLMLSHPVFGKNLDTWTRFLTAEKPAPRISRKREAASIMSKISDTFTGGTSGGSNSSGNHSSNISSGNVAIAESAVSSPGSYSRSLLLSHRDCEDYFQREKEWVHAYNIYTRDALEAFNSLVQAKERLYGVLGHFSTALTLPSPNESAQSKKAYRFFNLFSNSLNEYRKSFLVSNYNDEATLGTCLNLWSKYLDSEKQMLLRRTALLLAYENANRALDKVKGPKRDEAEQAKLEAERAFEDCSDTAREEIKRFHKLRSQSLAQALEKYREANLALCKDVYNVLDHGIQSLKSFDP